MKREQKSLVFLAAEKLVTDDKFIANALEKYKAAEGLSDEEVSRYLRCKPERLPLLALCVRPESSDQEFLNKVEEVALYAGADPTAILAMLRRIETIDVFKSDNRSSSEDATGFLLAARDDEEEAY